MKKTIIRITGIMKHRNGKKSEYWTIHMRKAILLLWRWLKMTAPIRVRRNTSIPLTVTFNSFIMGETNNYYRFLWYWSDSFRTSRNCPLRWRSSKTPYFRKSKTTAQSLWTSASAMRFVGVSLWLSGWWLTQCRNPKTQRMNQELPWFVRCCFGNIFSIIPWHYRTDVL